MTVGRKSCEKKGGRAKDRKTEREAKRTYSELRQRKEGGAHRARQRSA